MSTTAYRPSQWAQSSPNSVSPPLTILVPPSSSGTSAGEVPTEGQEGTPTFVSNFNPGTLYVFDNALSAIHEQELVITENPVQTGASISDHSYLLPARLSVQILMSDVMQSYVLGQFSGTQSRSVSAYQTLLDLQASQSLLQVATRLMSYSNMLIKSVRPEEDATTRYGLKCHVTFQQILLASVEVTTSSLSFDTTDSDLPQVNQNSPTGTTATAPVSDTVVTNNSVVTNTSTAVVGATNNASLINPNTALLNTATTILKQAVAVSSNINQLPSAIASVAGSAGYPLPLPVTSLISSLPSAVSQLAHVTNPLSAVTAIRSVVAPVAYTAGIGSTVQGAGSWSSSNVGGLSLVLSGVNRY